MSRNNGTSLRKRPAAVASRLSLTVATSLSRPAALGPLAPAQAPAAPATTDTLLQGFQTPPNSAAPRVWWHWMNGNVTKEGIKLDLEWMHRSHIGGFQNFDAALFTPQYVKDRLAYMTPGWKDAFSYA